MAPGSWTECELCERGQSPGDFQRGEESKRPLAGQASEYGAGYAGGERGEGIRDFA